ncbi:FAD:protein FMN transferase [Buchnera aphidicola]|uniref:FAD:protein FMN transferase n=1 Tax=Buchnera aphidicola TaxID=9 RepID=UPI003464AF55
MGTYWQVKIPDLKNEKHIKDIIQNVLNQDENMLSSWKEKSIVSQFNKCKKNALQKINKKFFDIVATALMINKKTKRKLDITIEPLISIWGFSTKKKNYQYPDAQKIKEKISIIGSKYLQLIHNSKGYFLKKTKNGVKINLSTIGEGFAVDHLSLVLNKQGIKNYTIAIGGTIFVKIQNALEKPKIIAIQTPTDKKKSIHLLVYLKNYAISTAGSYLNYYYLNGIRTTHIINPMNGYPIKHNLVSVSVIASNAVYADSWDTGLLILGFKKAKKLSIKEKLAVCLVIEKKKIFYTWISPAFKKFLVKN